MPDRWPETGTRWMFHLPLCSSLEVFLHAGLRHAPLLPDRHLIHRSKNCAPDPSDKRALKICANSASGMPGPRSLTSIAATHLASTEASVTRIVTSIPGSVYRIALRNTFSTAMHELPSRCRSCIHPVVRERWCRGRWPRGRPGTRRSGRRPRPGRFEWQQWSAET
jgi:hypothetical protein